MIRVFHDVDSLLVNKVRDFLDENSIDAVIFNDESYRLLVPSSIESPAVWILDNSKLTDAQNLIEEFEIKYRSGYFNNNQEGEDWLCDACGAENEAIYYVCWKCGKIADV